MSLCYHDHYQCQLCLCYLSYHETFLLCILRSGRHMNAFEKDVRFVVLLLAAASITFNIT